MPDEIEKEISETKSLNIPSELSLAQNIDFSLTVSRLEKRAVDARKRARLAIVLLVIGVFGIISILTFTLVVRGQYSNSSYIQEALLSSDESVRTRIESPFVRRVTTIMNSLIGPENNYMDRIWNGNRTQNSQKIDFVPPTKEESANLRAELKEALSDLEKAIQIADIGKKTSVETVEIAPIVSTAVFSVGTVGILILMIQISVMFIRYHLRLGELYDAQADALRASGGDTALAYALFQHLSPNTIEVGKSPTTLYEKAFDAIQAVATSKR